MRFMLMHSMAQQLRLTATQSHCSPGDCRRSVSTLIGLQIARQATIYAKVLLKDHLQTQIYESLS